MKRMKELRNKRGISQRQLARLVGVTPSAISAIERGETKEPRWSLVVAIAKELRVGARTLFKPEPPADSPEASHVADVSKEGDGGQGK